MRLKKAWSMVFVFLLVGTAMMGHAAALQDEPPLTYASSIHPGTCDDLDADPAYTVGEAAPNLDEAVDDTGGAPFEESVNFIGYPAAPSVAEAGATLDVTFDDLFNEDQPHALAVRASDATSEPPLACGELGGVEADGRVLIALQPQNAADVAGVAIFDEDDAGFLGLGDEEVNVTVYVFSVAPASVEGVSTPEPASVQDAGAGYAHDDWLLDVDWLVDRFDPATGDLNDVGELTIVGVFPRTDDREGIVPATMILEPSALSLTDTSEESIEEWRTELLRQIIPLGQSVGSDELEEGDLVVLYDDGSLDATALWWVLDYLGHDEKQMLNGGLDAWVDQDEFPSAGFPPGGTGPRVLTEDVPDSLSGGIDDDVLTTVEEVQGALEDPNVVLIDARSPEAYAAGHLPGAANIPASENVEAGDIRYWADAATLREMYAEAGVTPDTRVIAYGGEGYDPHVTYFTLRLLGYEQVEVYPGGWIEWSQFPELPFETSE